MVLLNRETLRLFDVNKKSHLADRPDKYTVSTFHEQSPTVFSLCEFVARLVPRHEPERLVVASGLKRGKLVIVRLLL